MRVFELGSTATIILNIGVWPVIHFLVGYAAARRRRPSFHPDRGIYRLAKFEAGGSLYGRVGVKKWKTWLPDCGDFFKPGFPKKTLRSRKRDYLEAFYFETCRAEFTHWLTMAWAPIFLLWNEWWVELIMMGYALAVNLPCIIVQRFNRGRLHRLLFVGR